MRAKLTEPRQTAVAGSVSLKYLKPEDVCEDINLKPARPTMPPEENAHPTVLVIAGQNSPRQWHLFAAASKAIFFAKGPTLQADNRYEKEQRPWMENLFCFKGKQVPERKG